MDPLHGVQNPFAQKMQSQGHLPPALEKWRKEFNKSFPSLGLNPKQFMKFIHGIEKMINTQIKREQEQMKKANEKLKRAETGKD